MGEIFPNYYRKCPKCSKEFKTSRSYKFYCSTKCRDENYQMERDLANPDKHLSKGSIGTIHELQVSVDLLRKGWSVFRAFSPDCPCDLIAMKSGQLLQIQVTKATKHHVTGRINFAPHSKHPYDVLALSFSDGTVSYIPQIT